MSIEVTLITSVLASALGSKTIAESLVQLFRDKFDKKSVDDDSGGVVISESRRKYLTDSQASMIANEAAIEALDETYHSTNKIISERMRQARLSFNVALVLTIIGVITIFLGVGLLYVKESFEQGSVTIAVGAVSEIVSVLVFGFNKETNNRLDHLRRDLSIIETARVGLSIAKQIEDHSKRDDVIAQLSLKLQAG